MEIHNRMNAQEAAKGWSSYRPGKWPLQLQGKQDKQRGK